jgi:hypothetical protein
MKKTLIALPCTLLIGLWFLTNDSVSTPKSTEALSSTAQRSTLTSSRQGSASIVEQSLARKGKLWETVAANQRDRYVASMPCETEAFAPAARAEIGEKVRFFLSSRMPEIEATVLNRHVDEFGTMLTNLAIPGEPEGIMHVAENPKTGFFLGQIFYQNYPIAYQFTKDQQQLVATRHEISDLVCSSLNTKTKELAQMGVPSADGLVMASTRVTKSTTNTAKCKPTIVTALSVADVRIAEGNTGTRNLVFTVTMNRSAKVAVTVDFATSDITATANEDYRPVTGTLRIARGRRSATISVPIIGDRNWEASETFALTLTNPVGVEMADGQAIGTIVNDDSGVPIFNSNPGATAVAYLDMDGQTVTGTRWNGGATIVAGTMVGVISEQEMLEICVRTAEDFAPFQINVTTDERVFNAAPVTARTRCIITPYVSAFDPWAQGAGGIAYLNSFASNLDDPCWTFWYRGTSILYTADTNSHEIGHTLGLRHHGTNVPDEEYYEGHGTGEVGWQPIMGAGVRNVSHWSSGEYTSASNPGQDDLLIISTENNFGYRNDDHSNVTLGATPLQGAFNRTASGIISTRSDIDVFSFSTAGGVCSFSTRGVTGQNVDILLELLDSDGNVITSANPDRLLNAAISTNLAAGNYFLRVSGVGRGNVLGDGYSDYGSIGQFTITGTAP